MVLDHLAEYERTAAELAAAFAAVDPAAAVPSCPGWTVADLALHLGTGERWAAAIKAVDPDEPCWNFAPVEQLAGFWSRRRLHETAVHLVDALQSVGGTGVEAIPAEVAADGVDEVFTVFLPRLLSRGFPSVVEAPLTVRATDTGQQWTLYLALWKRLPARSLTIEGDPAPAATFVTGRATP